MKKLSLLILALVSSSYAEVALEEVSVTATRTERATKDVPASVTVVEEEKIKSTKGMGLYDFLTGIAGVQIDPKNSGYDAKLFIRGAGSKAAYGVREIMVLLNGVPITDPDSLTRLDFVDTSLIKRVEVVKGPNSTLWGVNATGGVINVITKSPFEEKGGSLRIGFMDWNGQNHNLYFSTPIKGGFYLGLSASYRQSDNSWRYRNKFSTKQFSIQPSYMFQDGSTLENYISYTKADLQLPGSLIVDKSRNIDQWSQYIATGRAPQTADIWKHSGRYSEIIFLSSKYTKQIGNLELIPLIWFNHWHHYHPVTGRINSANSNIYGIDFQTNYKNNFGIFTSGFTFRKDSQDTKYYQYADYTTGFGGRITSTLSDRAGKLSETQSQDTTLAGIYGQQSFRFDKWIIDLGLRYDNIKFDISGNEITKYDFGQGKYVNGQGLYSVNKTYNALSPRIGILYKLTNILNIYGNISTASQTPTSSEISTNPNLNLAKVTSYEIGAKLRTSKIYLDFATYYMQVKDEIVRVIQPDGITDYQNAGKTEKKGAELSLIYKFNNNLDGGISYTYSNFKYKNFVEYISKTVYYDRSGKKLPLIPTNQYSIFLSYKSDTGIKGRIQADTYGSYYMDSANTEKYEGYKFVTTASVGYERKSFDFVFGVDNLFDKKYAVNVTKDTTGKKSYVPAAPRTFFVNLTYKF